MSSSQILKRFEGAVASAEKSNIAGGAIEGILIPSQKYLDKDFSVYFELIDNRLKSVSLKLKNPGKRSQLKAFVALIEMDLSKSLGKATRREMDNSASRTLELIWSLPTQRVSVLAVNLGPTEEITNGAFLTINYQQPENKIQK